MDKIKLMIVFVAFFFISLVTGACTDTNEIDISNIPCEGITDVINCADNITVLNLNLSTRANVSTNSIGGGMYNFSVNFTEGSYQLTDCANNTATIIIGDFPRDDLWRTAVIIALLGIAAVILTMARISFDKKSWIIKSFMYITGTLIIIIAIQAGLIFSRVDNITTMMTISMLVSTTAISIFFLYVLIFYTIEIVRSFRDARKKEKV